MKPGNIIADNPRSDGSLEAPMRFTLPLKENQPEQIRVGQHRAYKIGTVGVMSAVYDTDVYFEHGGQRLVLPVEPEPHPDPAPFIAHPSVFDGTADSLRELTPKTELDGVPMATSVLPHHVASQRAQVWKVWQTLNGIQFHWFYLIRSRCPWIEVVGAVGYTDLVSPEFIRRVARIRVAFGEEWWSPYAMPLGLSPIHHGFDWSPPGGGLFFGSRFDIRGRLLCRRHPAQDALGDVDEMQLDAAKHEPVWGVFDSWGGADAPWMTHREKPVRTPDFQVEAEKASTKWQQWLATPGNGYQDRPLTGKRDPSGTGDDATNYGNAKDSLTLNGEARRVNELLVAGADDEAMRPCHFFEADGSLVRAKKHPGIVTWIRTPHPQLGSDWLGKPQGRWWPSSNTGRVPDDPAHQSDLVALCAAALTGDPITLMHIACRGEMDLCSAAVRGGRAGEGREDRRIRGLVGAALIVGDNDPLEWGDAIRTVVQVSSDALAWDATGSWAVRQVFTHGNALRRPDGSLVPSVSTFHICLSIMAHMGVAGNSIANETAYVQGRAIVDHACKMVDGAWYVAYFWAWNAGAGPVNITDAAEWNEGRGWMWQYVRAAAVAVLSFEGKIGEPAPETRAKAQKLLEDIGPPKTVNDAEWQAMAIRTPKP